MPEAVGIAIIGTGMWARRLAPVIARTPELRAVTCYSRNPDARAAYAAELGCRPADTLAEAIEDPAVSGVLLLTPNHLHAEQTMACARAGRHVFVEKPLADRLADGRAMQAACATAGVTLMVGHAFRRLGAARQVKALLEAGRLGQVVLAEANFSLPGRLTPDKWRAHRATCPGGPLMQLGIHHIDTLHAWLGPTVAVHGSFAHLATEADIDDVGLVQMTLASGARAVVTGSYVSPRTFWLRLYGTRATLAYETDMSIWPRAEAMDEATTLTLDRGDAREDIAFEARDMLQEELQEFARCVQGEARPETGAAEGLLALAVVRGALEAHETGRSVAIDD